MKKNPHIEKIRDRPAWLPSEVLLLLTGRNYPNCTYELILLKNEQRQALSPDINLEKEGSDHYDLYKKITRAVKDGEIVPVYPERMSLNADQWSLKRPSVLSWIKSNKETIFPMRHFPDDTEDVLMGMLLGVKDKSTPESKDEFPPHSLKNWSQISFCALTEKACLEVSVDGKVFSESELTDKKFTKHNLSLLYQIVLKNGFFDKSAFPKDQNLNQSVKRLNKSLREIFEINKDSISYNQEAKGYKAAFQTEIDSTS